MNDTEIVQLERRADEIAATLKSLGHSARLLVLCALARAGEVTAGSLTGIGGLSQSALSQHLARMREEGMIAYRRDGQTLWYRIADPRLEELIASLHRTYCE